MKTIQILLTCLLTLGISSHFIKITEEERAKAIGELNQSKKQLLNTLDGLTEDQLNFKPDPGTWSVAEGVEHLAISENTFNQMLTKTLESPADPSRRAEVQLQDDELMNLIRDRSNKVKTSEPFEPSGQFGSFEETLKNLLAKRDEHIAYISSTEDDLRYHYGQLPFGTIDSYQMILFMSGHMDRHIAQMEEVINHDDFPE